MNSQSPTAQSGPSAENASWNDAYERARKIIHDHCPNGHWITGWNTLAMALASEFETPPAGARDAVTDAAVSLRGLAGVIRKHGTCAPSALEVVAERLEALAGKADGGES